MSLSSRNGGPFFSSGLKIQLLVQFDAFNLSVITCELGVTPLGTQLDALPFGFRIKGLGWTTFQVGQELFRQQVAILRLRSTRMCHGRHHNNGHLDDSQRVSEAR